MHAQQGLVCVLGLENGAIGNWSPIIHGLSKDHAVYNIQVSLLSRMIGGVSKAPKNCVNISFTSHILKLGC